MGAMGVLYTLLPAAIHTPSGRYIRPSGACRLLSGVAITPHHGAIPSPGAAQSLVLLYTHRSTKHAPIAPPAPLNLPVRTTTS